MITPTNYTIVSGIGKSKQALSAFDNALLDAGIGDYNLVKVSSILPANCKYHPSIDIPKGSIIFTAYATKTIRFGETATTGVGISIPENDKLNGVIFEHSEFADMNIEELLTTMCKEAMIHRSRKYKEIKLSTKRADGEKDMYVSIISAVAMW